MNTCKTCVHWKVIDSDLAEIRGIGRCKAVPPYWDATYWAEDGAANQINGRALKPEHAGKLAFAKDSSDYYAELLTLPDFGCVQHLKFHM